MDPIADGAGPACRVGGPFPRRHQRPDQRERDNGPLMPHQRSAAQALVFLTLALPMFISVAGLAIDGALLLSSRRELQSVADGAARAGATRLDMERLRVSGGSDVELDPVLATTAAHGYLQDADAQLKMGLQAAPDTRVEVSGRRVQ